MLFAGWPARAPADGEKILVKRSLVRSSLILLVFVLALPACRNRENAAGGEATETIAPADPQPQPTGTDAMTQTVDIEAGRSEAEGGVLTAPNAPAGTVTDTATTVTTTTGTAATATTTR